MNAHSANAAENEKVGGSNPLRHATFPHKNECLYMVGNNHLPLTSLPDGVILWLSRKVSGP